MREALAKELHKQMEVNKNIYLLTADLGFMVFEEIRKDFKTRFINVGVAESNMMGVAAGLALRGKTVFVYSIATFATYRTFESIRNDISQHNLPVIIVGSGAGLSYADAGPSHHALEDLAILKSIPNLNILTPSDPVETKWAINRAIRLKAPSYIRIGKKSHVIYNKTPLLKFGKANILYSGKDFLLFSAGNITENAIEAMEILRNKGLKGTLANFPTFKPFDTEMVRKLTLKHEKIFSVEEHSVIGGLGSSIADALAGKKEFYRIGTPDKFTLISGTQEYLRDKYGLSPKEIASFILSKI